MTAAATIVPVNILVGQTPEVVYVLVISPAKVGGPFISSVVLHPPSGRSWDPSFLLLYQFGLIVALLLKYTRNKPEHLL